MASRAFTVLAPNGRRQTVKCTVNTTILQILEDVCKKQGFDSSEYDIKHHNKVLDTSLTVQFSGLPNNAQLELATSTKTRKETEIMLALGLEDGSRVQGTFLPSSTLQEILNALCDSQKPNPVVIYMRREIYGEDLTKTDLRSLGLTSGRAMLRVVYKTPDELKTQANVSNVIPSKPVVEKPYKRVFQPVEESSTSTYSKKEPSTGNVSFQANKNVSAVPDVLKLAKEKITKSKETAEECSPMEVDPQEEIEASKESHVDSPSDNGATVTSVVEESQEENIKNMKLEDFPFTGTRNGLIYSVESGVPRPMDEPPDDFFNLTINDAKAILRDVRKNMEEEQEGKPLLTAALRELEESKKQLRQLSKYRKCIIRILFPNRVILQGVFTPKDSIKTVSEFVKEHLAIVDSPFYLYTTPPKCILPEDKMLIEVDCVPVALLHFGVEDQFKTDGSPILRDDLKDKFTTSSMASLAAKMIRNDRKEEVDGVEMDVSVAGCSKDSNSGNTTKRNSSSSGKVPKWFKGT